MDFDKWWGQQLKDPTKPITPRMAWDAATLREREACAKICDDAADNAWSVGEATFGDAFATAIRARSNA